MIVIIKAGKGFKLRVGLDDYMLYGKFLGLAKQRSAEENQELQHNSISTTKDKQIRIERRSCIHQDENSLWLPDNIRGYHFVHNEHFLAFLDDSSIDENVKKELDSALNSAPNFISPFTILTKGETLTEIEKIIEQEDYLRLSTYHKIDVKVENLLDQYVQNRNILLWGNSPEDGFPLEIIMQAVSYLFSAITGMNLKGRRVLGNYMNNIHQHLDAGIVSPITYLVPNRGTCLFMKTETQACLVGYRNDEFTKTLIIREGLYGLKVRNPKFNECIELL